MKMILRATCAALLLCAALGGAGCTSETTSTVNTNTTTDAASTTTTSTAPAPNTPHAADASAAGLPVTLPVLDAMFADEAFAGELKSKLQLTDEQISRLRDIAREEVGQLREGEGDDHSGTTAAATARASERIREVVGEEKAGQLAALVRERWGGGAGGGGLAFGGANARPNSVPSDTRIVVNAPAYRMDVFENGQLAKSYKIGIGYPEFPLPAGQRRADTIIFNPTWTPPDEPWVEAPGSKVKVGETVPAGSKLNPLGPIKIPIGQPSLIHGGKSPARLGSFASHGCVGLTNQQVQDFAVVLAKLAGSELTPADVAAYAKAKTETKNFKLARPVPVELRYETIVAQDGRLHIYRDVYGYGTNTEENLRRVLEAHGVSLDQLSEPERTQVRQALDEMARDATGRPTTEVAAAASPQPSPTPEKSANKNGNKNSNSVEGEKVTRNVKGRKEIVIEIAALRGKGYPAPAGGGFEPPKGGNQQQPRPAAKRRSA